MTRKILSILMFLTTATLLPAQIKIGGSIYGGGNAGDTGGSATVTVHAGDLNKVFGGARMADVDGSAFVHIDGEHASDNIFINNVYGGNDIAGTIGTEGNTVTVPTELTEVLKGEETLTTNPEKNAIDGTWNAFVRTSRTPVTTDPKDRLSLVIGSLFGGGNGDYDYTSDEYKNLVKPELGKTYLEILGGCIAHLYGGGNKATVTQNTTICINNDSPVLTETNVYPQLPENQNPTEADTAAYKAKLAALAERTGLSTFQSNLTSYAFNFARVFGGNNKADMAIRPTWNLQKGIIRDLYSGGNEGRMIHENGILLETVASSDITAVNVYGGCRKADVRPMKKQDDGTYADVTEVNKLDGYFFPKNFAARLLLKGGNFTNVYGGNDIKGRVYFGNAIGLYTTIAGDLYGGGNGSYAFTDILANKTDAEKGDFYYDPGENSLDSLNSFRPNAEQVSIHLVGSSEDKPTVIHGSVYCGGNSATLAKDPDKVGNSKYPKYPIVELKIGSYVIADNVYLGNNGVNMVSEDQLKMYADKSYSSLDLTDPVQFKTYMDGCAMDLIPTLTFDDEDNGDGRSYAPYSSSIGSFYCGGNVGSMTYEGANNMDFSVPIYIYDKVVGGCNNANVTASTYNARYEGGIIGKPDSDSNNKLRLTFNGLKIQPKRWPIAGTDEGTDLVWNTISATTGKEVPNVTTITLDDKKDEKDHVVTDDDGNVQKESYESSDATDLDRRLKGGNIYGGCYNSGHINGNVVIYVDASVVDRDIVFDEVAIDETGEADKLYGKDSYKITKRNSGVILDEQGMDVLGSALNVFGGGFGPEAEIWGSTTINLNNGYVFQVFGGGEQGVIGKGTWDSTNNKYVYSETPDDKYSTYINLGNASSPAGVHRGAEGDSGDMAEAEFIYGGGFEGLICGSTHVNLGNGRIFNSFAGSCNADIYGHTETYVGCNGTDDGNPGFPYIRDHIYGGNDLGGEILGTADFSSRISENTQDMVYNEKNPIASAYVEYTQGHVEYIFGGAYGDYDYTNDHYQKYTDTDGEPKDGFKKPYLANAFVNFKPNDNSENVARRVYGGGQGYSLEDFLTSSRTDANVLRNKLENARNEMQDRSYVLIDIPENNSNFANLEVFGGGDYSGLGMKAELTASPTTIDKQYSAVIDLMSGQIAAAYGGSCQEGITRRTVVNVPNGSTIQTGSIFGGAYGNNTLIPCDVYESNVNYKSSNALVSNAIYGGNNQERRTVYSKVNINAIVYTGGKDKDTGEPYTGTVYGAGRGTNTWAEYTEVHLNKNAKAYKLYGGGENGKVLNAETVQKYKDIATSVPASSWALGSFYDGTGDYKDNKLTNLENSLVRVAEKPVSEGENELDRYNTNVIIHEGATLTGYAYGSGYGSDATVSGRAYVAVLGGTVDRDCYGAGDGGYVRDLHGANFTAQTMVYIQSGSVRNAYGSGYRGGVGWHEGKIYENTDNAKDIDGIANVVIGDLDNASSIPYVTRNVYGGGEGGPVYGTANVTVNNGYIGYRNVNGAPVEEVIDSGTGESIDKAGNVFGGGYVAGTYTDRTNITMYGGQVRGSLFGGGEIGYVGRGLARTSREGDDAASFTNGNARIYKGGETHVYLYGGKVLRDVFGGGRGYDNWGGIGTKFMKEAEIEEADFDAKGFVFGSTDVHIRGGEVGTPENALLGYGNIFGGGDEGFVYSATGQKVGEKVSDEDLEKGMPKNGGGYYYDSFMENDEGEVTSLGGLTKDCLVEVAPYCKVKEAVTIDGKDYEPGEYVPVDTLNTLKNRNAVGNEWDKLNTDGIIIHNAVFAGGNITEGSDIVNANTITVYGNAAASLRDVYNIDLITLGSDEIGGLYGDGNLTLVDGFREIHIDNYGTDYYSLDPTMELGADYDKLSDRQKAYYQLKYVTKTKHTYEYWESKTLHTYTYTDDNGDEHKESYKRGQKVTPEKHESFSAAEKTYWTQGIKVYQVDDEIEDSEHDLMDEAEQELWKLLGVCSKYAGRPMNTIQRADMCGVFGSRLVLKGAQDRVPETVDYKDYTINRVDEVSLNKRVSQAGDTDDDAIHGNYFGIYSVVNYLGNLTSDVRFDDVRKTDNANDALKDDGTTTYYEWKTNPSTPLKYRNNGQSHNKVALASGVYLEIKREPHRGIEENEWGYITGVIELDLINVMQGMGGGYVYARNEHGAKEWHGDKNGDTYWPKVTLLNYNENARTYRRFEYKQSSLESIETSGNFVHNTKQIVDDCYPNGGIYNDGYTQSPAHYWFIKGSVYVYDQYISAYTGAANAYAEKVDLPLTISAASNGRLSLREVQPNYYAYYDKNGNKLGDKASNAEETFKTATATYNLNDPISYWDYRLLNDADKARFVEETYTTITDCYIGEDFYPAGYTLLPPNEDITETVDIDRLRAAALKGKLSDEDTEEVKYVLDADGKKLAFDYVFRPSNNLSHNTGYILTYDVNNPTVWDKYYTKKNLTAETKNGLLHPVKLDTELYSETNDDESYKYDHSLYWSGPTYSLKSDALQDGVDGVVVGQHTLKYGQIISAKEKAKYEAEVKDKLSVSDKEGQAEVEKAYIVISDITVKDADGNVVKTLNAGTPIIQSEYADQWSSFSNSVEPARVCTSLLQFSTTDFVYAGKVLTSAAISDLTTKVIAMKGYVDEDGKTAKQKAEEFLEDYISDAFYCKSEDGGLYGGYYLEKDRAYPALESFSDMPQNERNMLVYNYDALDLLIDPTYDGRLESHYGYKPRYDGTLSEPIYSAEQKIDYQAEFKGTTFTYEDSNGEEHTISTSTNVPSTWLSRKAFEDIPNEKRHYAPITVTAPGTYYVVKQAFMRGDIPYTVGQVIEESVFNSLTDLQKENIKELAFTEDHTTQKKDDKENLLYIDSNGKETTTETETKAYKEVYYYYCREEYTINEKGEGKPVTTIYGTTYNENNPVVPQGIIINYDNYEELTNMQTDFVIHGTSPTEYSTLYVSSESDINDLSKEKIITVIYLYEYDESDESGLNIVPVSERHIVNIHINFKSGIPQIGKLRKPNIVLPGNAIGMEIPSVSQGAYRVTNSGWEIFAEQTDAETGTNGKEYSNNKTPVYWYQNDYWIAYYAETYLGKTYSTPVQFNVANYHDLGKVMEAKEHHYYIDHKDVDREPKIYINDKENGLTQLENLFNLSLEELTYDETGQPNAISSGTLQGHMPMNSRVKGCEGLEFFLRTDLTAPEGSWTPIGNGSQCFSGNLHGDGHTISGLDHSLFNHLCGEVYNLGVTGSFTGAGIAETGDGYVENCWVKSTATTLPGDASKVNAVFGNPTRKDGTQVRNCYFWEDNAALYNTTTASGVTTSGGERGTARQMTTQQFYNGEVAFDLNGHYLQKRYYDHNQSDTEAMGTTPETYSYFEDTTDEEGNTTLTLKESKYGDAFKDYVYVENRFADGDFRYAGGSIPETTDIRLHQEEGKADQYFPIWPDDYLFFGQMLDYGYGADPDINNGRTHQELPSYIVRSSGRVQTNAAGNRVYRAPAYFRNSTKQMVHFNPHAVLPATKYDLSTEKVYPNLTAIDFTGGNGDVSGGYKEGLQDGSLFFPPMLDYNGLTAFHPYGQTRNLLVYADQENDAYTHDHVLATTLQEPAFTINQKGYNEVAVANTAGVNGHLVSLNGGSYGAGRNHFLVDKQDFYAPIAYTFGNGYRMWHQRTPELFVDTLQGWESISLPFTANIVSTHQKGELTHFYRDANGEPTDMGRRGHEYWLRQFKGNLQQKKKADGTDETGVYTADFPAPSAVTDYNKEYNNTFLWDYYYSWDGDARKDANSDLYQQYYNTPQTYKGYPRLTQATPYIIGFPGETYYEFDLSGNFQPENTHSDDIDKRQKQVITFASATGITINASDEDMAAGKEAAGSAYTFTPSYLNRKAEDGTYVLNTDGSAYTVVSAGDDANTTNKVKRTQSAFRPYFSYKAPTTPDGARSTRSIVFGMGSGQFGVEEQGDQGNLDESLTIGARRHAVVVTSNLRTETEVRITNLAGITVATFTLQPGETVRTPMNADGVYIVRADNGRYQKKLVVK